MARWPSCSGSGRDVSRQAAVPVAVVTAVNTGSEDSVVSTKQQRQHLVTKLIESQPIANQAQLVEMLASEGVHATQATVSRDLDELGAIKVRVPGGLTVYALPEIETDRLAPVDQLRRVLGEWVASVAQSENLVVLRTPPGCAHVVASALDRGGVEGLLGTVAGDDTLVCIAGPTTDGASLADLLRDLAGLATNG